MIADLETQVDAESHDYGDFDLVEVGGSRKSCTCLCRS